MRSSSLVYAAVAGLAIGAFATHGAGAMTIGSPTGLRAALETVDVTGQVHCRPYRHHHRYGWSRGCGVGGIVVGPGRREGSTVRSREGTEMRSREGTTVRSGGGSNARGEGTTKSSSESGTTNTRSSGPSKGGATKGGETGQSPSNQQPTK